MHPHRSPGTNGRLIAAPMKKIGVNAVGAAISSQRAGTPIAYKEEKRLPRRALLAMTH